jgi:hypothetical protein
MQSGIRIEEPKPILLLPNVFELYQQLRQLGVSVKIKDRKCYLSNDSDEVDITEAAANLYYQGLLHALRKHEIYILSFRSNSTTEVKKYMLTKVQRQVLELVKQGEPIYRSAHESSTGRDVWSSDATGQVVTRSVEILMRCGLVRPPLNTPDELELVSGIESVFFGDV